MFDGTPVLFRPGGDLLSIGHESVKITTVYAIDFLDEVQVTQSMPVNNYVLASLHFRNFIDRKADILIRGNKQIQHQGWKRDTPDYRSGQVVK
jgi:hypothetical protein